MRFLSFPSGAVARRWFITSYLMALMLASAHVAMRMATDGGKGVVLSAAFAVWPWLVYFVSLFLWASPRIGTRLGITQGLSLMGGLAALLLGLRSTEYVLAVEAPLLGILGGCAYAWWYSRLPAGDAIPRPGTSLPAFWLQDTEGRAVQSQELITTPALWLFYRGNWCPLCVAQIRELAESYRRIEALGVRVVLVSPQPEAPTRQLARRFAVPFTFLTDPGNLAARRLGLSHADGLPLGMEVLGYESETVLPTVLLTDTGGEILAVHQTDNYLHRPEPEYFLSLLGEHRLARSV
ncbi:MAG: redoxin domain-containing protein [Gammaproteobacteria bacterium]|nr:redoxin domain-containing protein [Gammaproteobacteria bacterium]